MPVALITFVLGQVTESTLAKRVVSQTVILPPLVTFLWSSINSQEHENLIDVYGEGGPIPIAFCLIVLATDVYGHGGPIPATFCFKVQATDVYGHGGPIPAAFCLIVQATDVYGHNDPSLEHSAV